MLLRLARLAAGALLVLVLAPAVPAQDPGAGEIPPAPSTFVTDGAGLLSGAVRARLEQRLTEHQRQTGQQVIVWTGNPQLRGDVEAWAARSFAAWKVGRRGQDDGVALFVLPAARKARIEVGYGLEPYLTDARAARILRERITPRLAAGQNDAAIESGVQAMLEAVAPAAAGRPPPGGGEPERAADEQGRRGSGWDLLWLLVVVMFLLAGRGTHASTAAALLYTLGSHGRSRRRWPGGPGGGLGAGGWGGGGGGFSGGGGRSGGGGATGSW